jgi:rare lipoprotein A
MKFLLGLSFIVLMSLNTRAQVGFTQEGLASYYANEFEGRTTASGERFSHKKATCAHMSIPFGALVKITNLENNATAIVRVNDRGPFVPDRIIDVSQSVAERLGMIGKGPVKVSIEVVDNNGYSIQKSEQVEQTKKAETPVVVAQPKVEKETSETKKTETTEKIEEKKKDSELFTLKVEASEIKGFSIQIGSYKELVNVLRIAADIQSSTKKETRVQVITINGDKIYRLMVGSFSNRKEAETAKEKIAKIYKDCFIVELKE